MKNILIIHGWMNNNEVFSPLAEELKENCNIHYLSYLGFDYEFQNKEECNLDFMVNRCKEYVNSNRIDIILAHSLGGAIALLASPYYSSKPCIILLSPVLEDINNIKTYLIKYLLPFKDSKVIPESVQIYVITKFIEISGINNRITKQNLAKDILNFDTCISQTLLKSITRGITKSVQQVSHYPSKIVVYYGCKDKIVHPRTIKRACKKLNISNLIEFKNGSHSLFEDNKDNIIDKIYNNN